MNTREGLSILSRASSTPNSRSLPPSANTNLQRSFTSPRFGGVPSSTADYVDDRKVEESISDFDGTESFRESRSEDESEQEKDGSAKVIDLEAGLPTEKLEKRRTDEDPSIVTWDGQDDPANPKNWPFKKKWAATVVVSSFSFISPVTSSMIAPALPAISKEFNITSDFEAQLVLSIFVLGYAVGPLFLGPLSEVYGRVIVLQLSNVFYFVWNLACGFSQSQGQITAFRFLAGVGGSACIVIGGGILGDCWRTEERGKAMSIYNLAPLLGPAVGPLIGGFITQYSTWRWCFWSTCAFCGFLQLLGVTVMRETWAGKILGDKARRLRKETGNADLHTVFEHKKFSSVMKVALVRPFRMISTQPIIIVLALYMSYIYGLGYLVLSTYSTVFSDVYHESVSIGGLNYISIGIGYTLGMQICSPLVDRVFLLLKKRNNGEARPEFRLPLLLPGALILTVGIFWYGWSAQGRVHWIMPNIGIGIFSIGAMVGYSCIQTYLVDAYTTYAASAVAACSLLRCLAAFGFPLFAPALYNSLGYGGGNSLLGGLSIVLGIPAPILLWMYGPQLRAKSQYAVG